MGFQAGAFQEDAFQIADEGVVVLPGLGRTRRQALSRGGRSAPRGLIAAVLPQQAFDLVDVSLPQEVGGGPLREPAWGWRDR